MKTITITDEQAVAIADLLRANLDAELLGVSARLSMRHIIEALDPAPTLPEVIKSIIVQEVERAIGQRISPNSADTATRRIMAAVAQRPDET